MVLLLDCSAELLHEIFTAVDPVDLSALARTCKSLNGYINPNRLLWKEVLLRNYDVPLSESQHQEPQWESLLRRYVSLEKVLSSDDPQVKKGNFKAVAKTAAHMVQSSAKNSCQSRNVAVLSDLFENQDNIDIYLSSSSLFLEGGTERQIPALTHEERQLSAKLHVYYGVPSEGQGPSSSEFSSSNLHAYAKARVYDLRAYSAENLWGPFQDDGSMRVDWEKLESIMIDLSHNLQSLSSRACRHFDLEWTDHFHGCSPNSFVSMPLHHEPQEVQYHIDGLIQVPSSVAKLYEGPSTPSLDAQDPYGVTGTWRRIVCFLDYTDLHSINFEGEEIPDDQPRSPIYQQEAIRLITVKIRVTKIEPPGPQDGQDYPVVHFAGTSKSLHISWDPNASSRIRGTVRQTPEGEIRWTSFSLFHGEERWRSEGIQVGGIRSARGVLGTWFNKDYELTGPAGPNAFWKISDDIIEDDDPRPKIS